MSEIPRHNRFDLPEEQRERYERIQGFLYGLDLFYKVPSAKKIGDLLRREDIDTDGLEITSEVVPADRKKQVDGVYFYAVIRVMQNGKIAAGLTVETACSRVDPDEERV